MFLRQTSATTATNNNAIHALPQELVAKLRSSLVASSFAQVTAELLQNSIDAHATNIEVYISLVSRTVEIRDDGIGIRPEDFSLLGTRFSCLQLNPLIKRYEELIRIYCLFTDMV